MRTHKYYEQKCIEHLNRVMVSHLCASVSASNTDIIRDMDPDYELGAIGKDGLSALINDVHFVALKTNFELFLRLSIRQTRLNDFDRLATESNQSVQVKVNSLVAGDEDLKLNVIEEIVPGHGLDRIKNSIKKATGVNIENLLSADSLWPQIQVCFQIRHLIEHQNSRVDNTFINKITATWALTSFGERMKIPEVGTKIVITDADISATYHAMKSAAKIISRHLNDWYESPPANAIASLQTPVFSKIDRIQLWGQRPDQINHKIVRAFLKLENKGHVNREVLRSFCESTLGVENFEAHYSQMKTDSGNSHGNVFYDDGHNVYVWPKVRAEIDRHFD